MSHLPHDLSSDFPESVDLIHRLKREDAHFARLADAYDEVNKQVYRAEQDLDPTDDFTQSNLRKERMRLKDEIAAILKAAA
jgi:uncharacterized protein YdcH (DUF465 family)